MLIAEFKAQKSLTALGEGPVPASHPKPARGLSRVEFELSTGRRVVLTGFFTGETSSWVDHSHESLADKVMPVVRRVYPFGDFQVVGDTWLEFISVPRP